MDASEVQQTGPLQKYMVFVAVEALYKFLENSNGAMGRRIVDVPPMETAVRYSRILSVGLVVLVLVSMAAARDLALVSNKTNGLSAVSLPDLVKVCKAQMNHWPDGKPVTFIMRAASTPEMKVLVEKILEMPQPQVNEMISAANRGRVNHPAIMVVDSDEDLVNKVASIPGAVGVVDVYSINSSVAVIRVGGKLPLEPGYLLHGN